MPSTDIMSAHYYSFLKKLLEETHIEKVLSVAMDYAIQVTGAERGLIILFGKNTVDIEMARNLEQRNIEHPEFEVSHSIIGQVRSTGRAVCLRNALEDPLLRESSSVERLKILSVICLPLDWQNEVFGVLYLDNRTVRGIFKRETITFAEEFARFFALAVHHALERKKLLNHVQQLESELRSKYRFEAIIGHHPAILKVLKLLSQVADTDATVIISGESGSGKELVAHALHFNNNQRSKKAFVPINCSAIPETLLESELFGHVKGAFTGAFQDKIGFFGRANGGTIFLDEVSEMPLSLQAKLLRILQSGEFQPVGSPRIHFCDVRVIAATSKNLHELVRLGQFREDLYYRLNVITITLPPLRERTSDIPLLIQHFLQVYSVKYGKENIGIAREAEALLMHYAYPGNVRELENIIQHAVVLAQGEMIVLENLPIYLSSLQEGRRSFEGASFRAAKQQLIETFEQEYINDCLQMTEGNMSAAAKIAGIDIKNFYDKMARYRIKADTFKGVRKITS